MQNDRVLEEMEQSIAALQYTELSQGNIFSAEDLWNMLLRGDFFGAIKSVISGIVQVIQIQENDLKHILITIVMLGILAAVIVTFSEAFQNHQVENLAYMLIYMVLITILMQNIGQSMQVVHDILENTVLIMKLFIPTYALAVGSSVGVSTAQGSYMILLLIVFLIESIYLTVLMPAVSLYVLLSLMNGLGSGERFSMFLDFLEKAINGCRKLVLGFVLGISTLHSLFAPALDSFERSAMKKVFTIIPGLGNVTEGAFDMVIGSAMLVKNSLGIFLTIFLISVCMYPILKLFLIACVIKVAAAIMGIISDKRLAHYADRIGQGHMMLVQMAMSGMGLFFAQITVVAFAGR